MFTFKSSFFFLSYAWAYFRVRSITLSVAAVVVTMVPLFAELALTRWSFQGACMVARAHCRGWDVEDSGASSRNRGADSVRCRPVEGVTREWGRPGCGEAWCETHLVRRRAAERCRVASAVGEANGDGEKRVHMYLASGDEWGWGDEGFGCIVRLIAKSLPSCGVWAFVRYYTANNLADTLSMRCSVLF
jgi:hypothetical protein